MIVLTILGCIYMIYSGKQAAGRGESVQKANLDWHKEYNDKRRAEEEAKKGKWAIAFESIILQMYNFLISYVLPL